jgi:hypothetical protein
MSTFIFEEFFDDGAVSRVAMSHERLKELLVECMKSDPAVTRLLLKAIEEAVCPPSQ